MFSDHLGKKKRQGGVFNQQVWHDLHHDGKKKKKKRGLLYLLVWFSERKKKKKRDWPKKLLVKWYLIQV